MAKGVAHAGKGKSLSSGEANENERRGWTEDSYRRKNKSPLNNYDWSRHGLNFEIVDGEIRDLGRQQVSLYRRYKDIVKNLDFKEYKAGATNQQHTYVELILSGSTEKMQKIAFGEQPVNYERNPETWHNWGVTRTKDIEQWALDCYNFVCERYDKQNVIGFEVHLDETEPHIHVNIVPVAIMKQRGRVGGYVKVLMEGGKPKLDEQGNTIPATYTKGKHVGEIIKISDKKYEELSDEKKNEYRKNERGTVRTISFSTYFGDKLEERSQIMSDLHDKFYEKVGQYWGLDRGDIWALLPEEEQRKRRRRTKEQAYYEQQAKQAKEKAEEEKQKAIEEKESARQEAEAASTKLLAANKELEKWGAILFDEKTFRYPSLVEMTTADGLTFKQLLNEKLHQLVDELNKPIGALETHRSWKADRIKEAKAIVTELEDALFGAEGIDTAHKAAILQLGKDLYAEAKSMIAQTYKDNERLKKENQELNTKINTLQGDYNTVKKINVELAQKLELEETANKLLGDQLQRERLAKDGNGNYLEWTSGPKKGQKVTKDEYQKMLRENFNAKEKELKAEKVAREKEREENRNEWIAHKRHMRELKEMVLAFFSADVRRFINIIIKHWKAEIKEFARDAMNDIKSILFGAESTVDQRKTYVSRAFVWANVFADLEMDEQWKPDHTKLESLREDAMRIAEGSWESHRQERQHQEKLKQLLSDAADAVISLSSVSGKKDFTPAEKVNIDAYLEAGGSVDEIWEAAKESLGTWDTYAKRVLYAYASGESVHHGLGY